MSNYHVLNFIGLLFLVFSSNVEAKEQRSAYELIIICAAGGGIEINADMNGTLRDLFEGGGAQGSADISTFTKWLELFPEQDRLPAAQLYHTCIAGIVNPGSGGQQAHSPQQGAQCAGLTNVEVSELGKLLSAAQHHYRKFRSRFEHRITGDLIRIYEQDGLIYFYGSKELHRRSKVAPHRRILVANEYRTIVEDIIDTNYDHTSRSGAVARVISNPCAA